MSYFMKAKSKAKTQDTLESDYILLRDPIKGKGRIEKSLANLEKDHGKYLEEWYSFSKENGEVYPSQGLLTTPHDYLNYHSFQMLPQEKVIETLRLRWFFLELFNHPYRIHYLKAAAKSSFSPPPKIHSKTFENASATGLSLSIGDLGASVVGSSKERTSRTERYAQGPFVKLGKSARMLFVGSASPDVWNSSSAIATMAASHCIATAPRNSIMVDVKRQTDLVKEAFSKLNSLKDILLAGRRDKNEVAALWNKNIGGVLEASSQKALPRALSLFKAGVRLFRIYSPEPGTEVIKTTKLIRKKFGEGVEIFVGQIIDTDQAKRVEEAGADGVFVGIGGGGRCITGLRSGSVIDWPSLVWKLRGEISIPVIVEGGASDHIAVSLLLGATGISTSRVVAGGTIESPGGMLFCSDSEGKLFKPYGGEASARTKYLENKVLPYDVHSFVEGETSKAELSYVKHALPTLTYNLHLLNEDAILAMVFRNVSSITQLHAIDPSPLRRNTSYDLMQRNTH